MLGHLWHAGILTTLILLLQLLVVQRLLLLFLSHVATVSGGSWHACGCGRERRNIIRGRDVIASVDTILCSRRFRCVEAGLEMVS